MSQRHTRSLGRADSLDPATKSPLPTSPAATAPAATPSYTTIADARTLAIGTNLIIRATLTTPFGLLDGSRHVYVEDNTGAISLATAFDASLLPVGTELAATGTIASHGGELTLDVASPEDVVVLGTAGLEGPIEVATALACEPLEAHLVRVEGTLVADPGSGEDGTLSVIDDGSGPLPVLAPTAAGISPADLPHGALAALVGVIQQISEDPAIYRLVLHSIDDLTLLARHRHLRRLRAPP